MYELNVIGIFYYRNILNVSLNSSISVLYDKMKQNIVSGESVRVCLFQDGRFNLEYPNYDTNAFLDIFLCT